MKSVALEARQRVFGISAELAQSMPETSSLGKLKVQKEITQRQFDAAGEYAKLMMTYDRLFPIKPLQPAGDLDRGGGYDASEGTDEWYIQHFRKTSRTVASCRDALMEADRTDSRCSRTVANVVFNDAYMPHLVGPLRLGLNALARVFDLPLPGQGLDIQGTGMDKFTIRSTSPAG